MFKTNDVHLMTNDGYGKKYKNQKILHRAIPKVSKVEDPIMEYKPVKKIPVVADFPYRKFEKIAALVPFTQKEWANILHLSERTFSVIQR